MQTETKLTSTGENAKQLASVNLILNYGKNDAEISQDNTCK